MNYEIREVRREECAPFIMGIHYAKRWPSVSYAFGLYRNGELSGVITYGTPPSAPLRRGVAGDAYSKDILELNRLCLRDNLPNEASRLVGGSLKMLPRPKIVVSFADISQNHEGVVYQATNFLYCGLSAKRTDWKVRGKEHLHGQTVADEFRGVNNQAQAMRKKYGDDFYLAPRPRKHRYIFLCGGKKWRKKAIKQLKYKVMPYPKAL
jgi:hypothetical protein